MNLLCLLRAENASLITTLHKAGHTIWCQRELAVLLRQRLNLPIQPFDWAVQPTDMIDAVMSLHATDPLGALVVWSDAPGYLRAAVLAAKHLGIPTYEITHGALNTYKQGHFECDSHVDTILAPGQEEADFRRFYGQTVKVLSVGKPSFDWIATCDVAAVRKATREFFKLPDRRPIIVYGMTWRHPFSTWERDEDCGEWDVFKAHMALQSICAPFLIIKPHYARASDEFVSYMKNALDEAGMVEYAIYRGDSRALIPAADLLVSHKSSLLVEAVLLDIPAVGFDFREFNDFARYAGRGIKWVSRREDLQRAMARCLLDSDTRSRLASEREFAKHYFNGPNDGLAAKRCAAIIGEAA